MAGNLYHKLDLVNSLGEPLFVLYVNAHGERIACERWDPSGEDRVIDNQKLLKEVSKDFKEPYTEVELAVWTVETNPADPGLITKRLYKECYNMAGQKINWPH